MILGEEAHIRAFAAGGPRYDPNYPPDKLESYENRILLCPTHHAVVDKRGGADYSVSRLLQMKRDHEAKVLDTQLLLTMRAYCGGQHEADERIRFRQAGLDGPSVESMFVDVPFSCARTLAPADFIERLAADHPGDLTPDEGTVGAGAAQALLHPGWHGNALIVGGPGQGKSTLLQYVCQFFRARFLGRPNYTGDVQGLRPVTELARFAVKIELRQYAKWASTLGPSGTSSWPSLEGYLAEHIAGASGGREFSHEHLVRLIAQHPLLFALDGLDEVADLKHREAVADQIVAMQARLMPDAKDLVVLVTTRPGSLASRLWSSAEFPRFNLHRLTAGLRLQYLDRWLDVSSLSGSQRAGLRQKYLDHESLPHIRDLASYPMQFAILLNLLHAKGLFPKERTDLYRDYLEAFLDREEAEQKDPLISDKRKVLMRVHAFLGWHLQTQAESATDAGQIPRAELRSLLRRYFEGAPQGQAFADELFGSFQGRVLCLIEREKGFEFEVQSLREYFAALHVDQNASPSARGKSRADCFGAMVVRPYWLNVCRFLAGMFTYFEVSGLPSTLRELAKSAPPEVHTQLRIVATRLLDDRTFSGHGEDDVAQMVAFILEGAGAQLAEDGLLDDSGSPLVFADDSGRAQAVDWLKRTLSPADEISRSLARAAQLRRNASAADHLAQWWWELFETSQNWFRIAVVLGVLASEPRWSLGKLAAAVKAARCSENEWASDLLVEGEYNGSDVAVLAAVVEDLNAGAGADVTDPTTPAEELCAARNWALGVHVVRLSGLGRGMSSGHPIVQQSQKLGPLPALEDVAGWTQRLRKVAEIWGSGWVLRFALTRAPMGVDLDSLAALAGRDRSAVSQAIAEEAARRAHRSDAAWWQDTIPSDPVERCAWVASMMAVGGSALIASSMDSLSGVIATLSRKHYVALLRDAQRTIGQLNLHDEIRTHRIVSNARTLWLVFKMATSGTRDVIIPRIADEPGDLFTLGHLEAHRVITALSGQRAVPLEALHHCRSSVQAGATAGLRLGTIGRSLAAEVIARPEDWPADVVAKSEAVAGRRAAQRVTISRLADQHRWFLGDAF